MLSQCWRKAEEHPNLHYVTSKSPEVAEVKVALKAGRLVESIFKNAVNSQILAFIHQLAAVSGSD